MLKKPKTKKELVKHCINGACRIDDNWALIWWERYFYTLKAIICILLGWKHQGKEYDWIKNDPVLVGMHSFKKSYNYEYGCDDARFVDIQVGYGWLENWKYNEVSDGWL